MKILLAAALGTGHINPILAIGRILLAEGHEIGMLSSGAYRERIEAAGVVFHPLPPEVDFKSLLDAVPELKDIPPGPQLIRVAMERLMVDTIPGLYRGVQQALQSFPADLIVGDEMNFGLLPMLLGPRSKRPSIVMCGTSILHTRRDDGAPGFVGLPPATTQAQRDEYAAIAQEQNRLIHHPVGRHLDQCLGQLGVGPLSIRLFESGVELADAYLQLSVPGFEYPRETPHRARFVGIMPIIPKQAPVPAWGHELDGPRKVVLVTQGTVANHDFDRLVTPALAALENEPGLLVVVTTGGRPIEAIPSPIPANARISSYLPFEWLLPKVDVLVTNGGYGSVNQALSFGIPLVSAGLTEDKAEVNARVAWSGVGINLATNEPTPERLREAVRAVLNKPDYRLRAGLMAAEFSAIDTRTEILRVVRQVTQDRPIESMAAE
jgi:UDP:flavonoid glycosyltransferase YjiC (YdhE family)